MRLASDPTGVVARKYGVYKVRLSFFLSFVDVLVQGGGEHRLPLLLPRRPGGRHRLHGEVRHPGIAANILS